MLAREVDRQAIVAEHAYVSHFAHRSAKQVNSLLTTEGQRLVRAVKDRHDQEVEQGRCACCDVDMAKMYRIKSAWIYGHAPVRTLVRQAPGRSSSAQPVQCLLLPPRRARP